MMAPDLFRLLAIKKNSCHIKTMCYSKEVSLAAGTVMASVCAYFWFRYVKEAEPNLKEIFTNVIYGYLCVASHQFSEYLSLITNSTSIFKIGLIGSLSAMFFFMRSLEHLTKIRFGSPVFFFIIVITSIATTLAPIYFTGAVFWITNEGIGFYIWGTIWLSLFYYWNFCILYCCIKLPSMRSLFISYGFFILNITFILALSYSLFSFYMSNQGHQIFIKGLDLYTSLKIVNNFPSIWCNFGIVQVLFAPLLFKLFKKKYLSLQNKISDSLSKKAACVLIIATLISIYISTEVFPILLVTAGKTFVK